jgi:hypothetical protein
MKNVNALSNIIEQVNSGNSLGPLDLANALMHHPSLEIKVKRQVASLIEIKNSSVSTLLSDNSVLVFKNDRIAVIAAPETTEIKGTWDEKDMVFDLLDGNEWYIPSIGHLYVAYLNSRNFFYPGDYWSIFSSHNMNACYLNLSNGIQEIGHKAVSRQIRAFRTVTLD